MSTHTISELNALQAGLHQPKKSATQLALINMLLPKYKLGDYFVTLTFSSEYNFEDIRANKKVHKFLHSINRKIFGVKYDKKYKQLKSDFVYEQNYSQGWHIHMILEMPEQTNRFDGDFDKLIYRTWQQMNWSVVQQAQKVISITETLENVLGYMMKKITAENQHQRFGVLT